MSATAALWLALSLVAAPPAARAGEAVDRPSETVILLHGLVRTDRSMRPLEERLGEAGFRVHNVRYDSTGEDPEALVADLREQLDACCAGDPVVHFVGHSLGGILARAYIAKEQPHNVGRVVMLAPPNHGSELVDTFGETHWFGWILGPTARQLGTDPDSLPNRLPAPTYEVGVIAGTDTVNPVGSLILPDEDDGMVTLESTKLDGMTDFLVVPSSHAFIMRSSVVADQVVHFLREGHFEHEAPE